MSVSPPNPKERAGEGHVCFHSEGYCTCLLYVLWIKWTRRGALNDRRPRFWKWGTFPRPPLLPPGMSARRWEPRAFGFSQSGERKSHRGHRHTDGPINITKELVWLQIWGLSGVLSSLYSRLTYTLGGWAFAGFGALVPPNRRRRAAPLVYPFNLFCLSPLPTFGPSRLGTPPVGAWANAPNLGFTAAFVAQWGVEFAAYFYVTGQRSPTVFFFLVKQSDLCATSTPPPAGPTSLIFPLLLPRPQPYPIEPEFAP